MSESLGGMPLLSGPPPEFEHDERAEMSCRKCNKEFNLLFARGRKCNHCGFSYCHSCSDYQALMPRAGTESGYDPMTVCAFCIQYLSITAGGKGYLRAQPIAKLKNYIQAYNIKLGADIIEKDDVINAIMMARGHNGCLPRANEDHYRKHAVPNGQNSRPRGIFSRNDRARNAPRQNIDPSTPWVQPNTFARPDLQPDPPQPAQNQTRDSQQQQQEQNRSSQQQSGREYPPPPGPPPPGAPPPGRPPPPPRNTYNAYSPNPPRSTYNAYNPTPPPRPPHAPSASYRQPSYSSASSNRSTPDTERDIRANYSFQNNSNDTSDSTNFYTQTNTNDRRGYSYQSQSNPNDARPRTTSTPNSSSRPYSSTPNPPPQVPQQQPPSTQSVPTLDELLIMSKEQVSRLSVGNLKAILHHNHVPARLVLEKSELVARVSALVETERRERAQMQAVHEQEEREARERELERRRARERLEREERERHRRREAYRATVESASEDEGEGLDRRGPESGLLRPSTPPEAATASSASIPETRTRAPPPPPGPTTTERSGLCVVCQDEDANIVIVDCGHLALCRACADLVWTSTKECPLCRTRIVTESRLLRVFKS